MAADADTTPSPRAEEPQSLAVLEFYQRETHYWDQQMRSQFQEVGTILTTGVSAALGLTIALVQFQQLQLLFVVLLILPVLWLAAFRSLADGMAAAAYRRQADFETERCLRHHHAETSLRSWAGRAGFVVRSSPSVRVLQPALLSLSIVIWIFCAFVLCFPEALAHLPGWIDAGLVIAATPLLICAGVAGWASRKIRSDVLAAVNASYPQD